MKKTNGDNSKPIPSSAFGIQSHEVSHDMIHEIYIYNINCEWVVPFLIRCICPSSWSCWWYCPQTTILSSTPFSHLDRALCGLEPPIGDLSHKAERARLWNAMNSILPVHCIPIIPPMPGAPRPWRRPLAGAPSTEASVRLKQLEWLYALFYR